MPVNNNGQFDYPTQDWAAGKMRKAMMDPRTSTDIWGGMGMRGLQQEKKRRETKVSQANGEYPQLSAADWKSWHGNQPSGPVVLGEAGNVRDMGASGGFLVDKNHPQLDNLKDSHDIYSIPDDSFSDRYLFARPKAAVS